MVDEGCWVLVNGMLMVVTLAKGCRIRPQMAQIATSDPTLPFWNLHFGSSRGPFSPFGRALRTISEQLVTAHTTWMGLIPIQGVLGCAVMSLEMWYRAGVKRGDLDGSIWACYLTISEVQIPDLTLQILQITSFGPI